MYYLYRLIRQDYHALLRHNQRRDRFHRGPQYDGLSGGDPAFQPPRIVRAANETGLRVVEDLVMHVRPEPARRLEAQPHFHPFHGLDAHERHGEPGCNAAIPLGIAPKPDRGIGHDYFENTAERVAFVLRLPDPLDHLG